MKKFLYFTILIFILQACSVASVNKKIHYTTKPNFDFKLNKKTASIFSTAETTTYRLTNTHSNLMFGEMQQPKETDVCVFIDPTKTFQTFIGIGGAFTDASAETYYKLPESQRQSLLKAYFDTTEGIGYTLGRTNMNSCDFSSYSYTYVMDNDKALNTFNIDQDRKYKIPLIKEAIHAAGGKLLMYISPWSPPAWMKDNNSMLKGGRLKEEFYLSWAQYYVKYIKELENESIPIWGLSVQNEPMATQTWESCIYTAEEEAKFIKEALGPALYKAGMREKKLIIWDHNRDLIYQRASTTLKDPEVAKYVWGIGFHWYETWTGSEMMFDNLRRTAEAFPDKHLIFTEGCKEKFSLDSVNNWSLGERYGMSMINDFNAGTTAWTDWNILLDEKGGPNHVGNFCFAPVHANTHSGKLIFTNAYYYIGHFSKFIRPGAKRVSASTNRTDLLTTAFLNTDGKLAVVVMNQGLNSYAYNLWIEGQAAKVQILPRSIQTVLLQ
ncbi:glycoside hydrolase family 30 beta sandwich domain-containing protein [Haoranjiania flava]|uniref:Glycosyl hydrolase n=1 Tax=Haoranjiania flava TaxID=1856322 RepID=A0AAE3IM99_9BACT|nr:glycoside hydrolase family 30 protein [Haoranjiania flava]MCU7693758.1 glycosyl hydrolase [Haoranjiania flava]